MPADPAQAPIVVLAFNRPDYLAATLESLMRQEGVDVAARRVFLFQDGGYNRASGVTYCSDAMIGSNIDMFRRIVPHGIPLVSYHNIGIALNFDRAERFVFEELEADAAVFLEDDLVLGRYYLAVLDRLVGLALTNERVGYVAAYGNPKAPLAIQRGELSRLIPLGHNWAFGLTRRQWLKQRPYVERYLSIVRGQDYLLRDHDRIIDLFHEWGLGAPGSSQDIAKSHACILTGSARVNTYACYGHYIGRRGVHFSNEVFEELGFGGTEVLEEDLFRPAPPSEAELLQFIAEARHGAEMDLLRKSDAPPPTPDDPLPVAALERLTDLFAQGRFDEAETLCVEWLARAPGLRDKYGHPAFLKELTRLGLARGRLAQAREFGDRLAALLPAGDPCVNLLFGRAYARMGLRAEAAAQWHAVLDKMPESVEAQQGLLACGASAEA
jgi:hypothetical protein